MHTAQEVKPKNSTKDAPKEAPKESKPSPRKAAVKPKEPATKGKEAAMEAAPKAREAAPKAKEADAKPAKEDKVRGGEGAEGEGAVQTKAKRAAGEGRSLLSQVWNLEDLARGHTKAYDSPHIFQQEHLAGDYWAGRHVLPLFQPT